MTDIIKYLNITRRMRRVVPEMYWKDDSSIDGLARNVPRPKVDESNSKPIGYLIDDPQTRTEKFARINYDR